MRLSWNEVRTRAGGRLKSEYSYSVGINYNTFPTPPEGADLSRLELLAQAVLDARSAHPAATLAELYDPDLMPPELRRAHQAIDRAGAWSTCSCSTRRRGRLSWRPRSAGDAEDGEAEAGSGCARDRADSRGTPTPTLWDATFKSVPQRSPAHLHQVNDLMPFFAVCPEERHWAPPLGAVLGFALALWADRLLQ